ncbi:MAG: hypothetical protein K2K16_07170 [Ruminococcus sp.]|nr:hypothetical protein [Ruminococcus sp.]
MPVINRIRFVNISYDNRNIKDCIFDMYNGCDALINLSNGGGKSVMVQLIFQPVIPGASLSDRNIFSYLPKNDTPIHIMIEWVLDNTEPKQYYLTGICMGLNKENPAEKDEQNNLSYRYFTYTHSYTAGNESDIEHIPVKEVKGKTTVIYKYDTVFEKIKSLSRTVQDFRFFTRSRLSEYEENLSQHRIYRSEWELLKKINQVEGGLINSFEKYRTSDELFDHWILKTVSDNLQAGRKYLIECITELVKPMIKENDNLYEKELFEKLLTDVNNFNNNFNDYCNVLDTSREKERFLAGVLKYTRSEQQRAEKSMEQALKIQEKCREEELHIDIEELSESIKNSYDKIQETEKNITETEEKLSVLKKTYEENEYNYRCMQASEYYCEIKKYENNLNAERSIIETLEKGQQTIRIRNIGFTLNRKYSDKIVDYDKKLSEYKYQINEIGKQIKDSVNRKKILENEKNGLERSIAILQNNNEKFSEERKKYRENLGELPQRDITGNLITESVVQIGNNLENALKSAQTGIKNLDTEKKDTENKIVKYNADTKKLRKDIEEIRQCLIKAEIKYNNCLKQTDSVKNILAEYEINERYLFEKENNINIINEKITGFKGKSEEIKRILNYKSELLEKFRKKQLHISREFADILEKNVIEYQTGEDFLSNQPPEYFEYLVKVNPMLPYCFIVSDGDADKVIDINEDFSVDRVCPVIRKSSIEKSFSDKDIHFYSLFNRKSICRETKENYGEYLENEIKELKERDLYFECKINRCRSHLDMIEKFSYTAEEYRLLATEVENNKKQLENLQQELSAKETVTENLRKKCLEITENISEARNSIRKAENKINLFNEYIRREEKNIAETEERYSQEEKVVEIRNKIEIISGDIENFRQDKEEKSRKMTDTEYNRKECRKKSVKYSAYNSGEFIDAPEQQLEKEYEELSSETSRQLAEHRRICEEMSEKITINKNRLDKFYPELSESDYNIEYNEDILLNLEKKSKDSEKLLNETNAEITVLKGNLRSYTETYKREFKKLKRYDLTERLSDNEITGNYSVRREKCIEEKKSAEIAERNFRNEERILSGRINGLEKIVPSGLVESNDILPKEQVIDIDYERKETERLKTDVLEKMRNMKKLYENIRKSYENINDPVINKVIEHMDFHDYESYDECFHLYNELRETADRINDEIKMLSSRLDGIKDNVHHITKHIYEHAETLYEKITGIFNNSYANIQGNRRHRIMSINIPPNPDRQAENRIADFVNNELLKIRNNAVKENYDDIRLQKEISKAFSDRIIINVFTDMSTYKIKVYKVCENSVNSGLKLWEEKHSGGERFITYFTVFSALTAYARMASSGESNETVNSVFLSDNPFGATSSPHLLDALAVVKSKYNLQLICFTALEQSSITKNFDLIYQLTMRPAVHSNKSFLEISDVIRNNDEISADSNLEFISVRNQMSLFDESE